MRPPTSSTASRIRLVPLRRMVCTRSHAVRQFVSIVSAELVRAQLTPTLMSASAPRAVDDRSPKPPTTPTTTRRRDIAVLTLAAAAGWLLAAAARSLRVGKNRLKPD